MKQDDIDNMMKNIDRKCKLPKHWDKFIEEQTKNHNYIVKNCSEKTLYCTNCQHTFYQSKYNIGTFQTCPNCNNKYKVVSVNSFIPWFTKSVSLLQRTGSLVVVRVFEIETYYMARTKSMNRHIQEYCRIIPGKGKFLSNCVWFYMGYMRIYHSSSYYYSGWREYDGVRFFSDFASYPYNEKKLIKGTLMEYAPINQFTSKFYPYNFIDAIELAAYESFELLWNMKLYNLAFAARKLNKNGSFYKRFGLSKDYLKFMQDNDINYRELRILQLIKKKDIGLIRKLAQDRYSHVKFLYKNQILEEFINNGNDINYNTIETLKQIQNFIPLKKLKNYQKALKHLNIYKDYLYMSKKLALNYKSRKDLFPRNLISRHDKMQNKIKVTEDIRTQFGAYLRFLELSKYIYDDNKYMIFPAPSIDDLKDEGRQQGNCVGNMYLNPYIECETEIFFIRELSDFTKSFITLEFKNGQVKQKELPQHGRDFTPEQIEFIDKWVMYRGFVDKREKYRNKTTKVVQYNLEKLVA